jgi:tetratricopeptide (TPR) repeat protein
LEDPTFLTKKYANFENIYRVQNMGRQAIRYYILSLDRCRKGNLESAQGEILNNLGLVCYDINNFELALDLFKKINIENENGNIWLNIGAVHFEKGAYDKTVLIGESALTSLI